MTNEIIEKQKKEAVLQEKERCWADLVIGLQYFKLSFYNKNMQVQYFNKGITVIFSSNLKNIGISRLNIFNPTGRQLAHFSDIAGDRLTWTAPEGVFNTGVYIVKAQLSDKSIISQTFMITR